MVRTLKRDFNNYLGDKASEAKSGEEGEEDEAIDPTKLSEIKMQVQNAQVEEPKIVEEARNKQKEKRSEALEKERLFLLLIG